jgi:nrdC.11
MKELNTIVRMKFGSVLYGTNSPASDTDIKGVFIPAAEDIILQRAPKTVQMHTGNPNSKNTSADVDYDMYSLHYYLQLLAEGQVVALDMLFAPDSMLEISTPVWDTVRRHREQLICKDTKAFVGYCRTQAAKYGVKGGRIATLRAVVDYLLEVIAFRHHEDVRLGEIYDNLPTLEHTRRYIDPVSKRKIYEVCGRKFQDTCSIEEAWCCMKKILDNYGQRAFLAEKNEGIDWKAVSHAFRVCYEVLELLSTHRITFPLGQRDFIKAVKYGKFHYKNDYIGERLEELMNQVERVAAVTDLPAHADRRWIDEFVFNVYSETIR